MSDPQKDLLETTDTSPISESPQNGHQTLEIRLPLESHDLAFQVAAGATDSTCKLIAFLSPKGVR